MKNKSDLRIINMDTIQSEEIKWLWFPYIPYGKITIIQGDPGQGKTTFVLNLAAKLSLGQDFEIDDNCEERQPINVIYQTAEDGLADTVKPRLEAAGADCKKIMVIDESERSLSMTDIRIERAIEETGAKVVILDPIQAYLGDNVDMNRANETREVTKRLATLAERTGCAIILIGHMNKGSGTKAAYRGIGSIDIFAVARSVLLVARVPDRPEIRVLAQIKNNLAPEGNTVAFQMTDGKFNWFGEYEISVEELLGGYTSSSKSQQAVNLLKSMLTSLESVPANEIFEKGKQLGISKRTIDNAKHELHVKSIKVGSSWYWSLD
jgi:RecA-family ATPase